LSLTYNANTNSKAPIYIIYLLLKIVHEVQQEKLKYTKETEQYTALGYQSLSTKHPLVFYPLTHYSTHTPDSLKFTDISLTFP